jgi:hypothetical protein
MSLNTEGNKGAKYMSYTIINEKKMCKNLIKTIAVINNIET